MILPAPQATSPRKGFWSVLMRTAHLLFRIAARWLLRSRNPQVTTYFRDRVDEPPTGRPSAQLVRETRDRRLKLQHR